MVFDNTSWFVEAIYHWYRREQSMDPGEAARFDPFLSQPGLATLSSLDNVLPHLLSAGALTISDPILIPDRVLVVLRENKVSGDNSLMVLLPSLEAIGNNIELGNVLVKPDKRGVWIPLEMLRRVKDVFVIVQNAPHSAQHHATESLRDARLQ